MRKVLTLAVVAVFSIFMAGNAMALSTYTIPLVDLNDTTNFVDLGWSGGASENGP